MSQYLLTGFLQSKSVPIVLVRPYCELPTCGLEDVKVILVSLGRSENLTQGALSLNSFCPT